MTRSKMPLAKRFCRDELILALDLIAACVIVQVFLDQWVAAFFLQLPQSPVILLLSSVPNRAQLSLGLSLGMLLLIVYRMKSGDRFRADRGMFVLGCGAVAGWAAHVLKIIFGRSPPEALSIDGAFGFHFLNGGDGLDSFPSSHAAMAAGIAGALSVLWPVHRNLFIAVALVVSASRFVVGAHYPSDALLGFAVGLGTVMLVREVFQRCGIQLQPQYGEGPPPSRNLTSDR